MASVNDTSDKKVLTLVEVQQLAAEKDKYILVIDNHIYDVSKFIDEVCNQVIQIMKYPFIYFLSIQVVKKS